MEQSLRLDDLSSPSIQKRIANGWDTVLVSLGSTEQHGPALPLCVDVLHGRETCVRAARILGRTLVGPDITLGHAPQHAMFAGSISLREDTLCAVLEDVAESLARAGFKLVYFWIAHAENFPVLKSALPGLAQRFPGCTVAGLASMADYGAATWEVMGPPLGAKAEAAGSHAGEIETSIMLAAAPQLVRMEAAAEGNPRPFSELVERMMREGMAAVSPNGVLGDQRPADAGRGHAYLDTLARYLANDVGALQRKLGLRPK
jgi:creatinine amidohydrolase